MILTWGHVARASSSKDALPSAASVCSTVRPQESAWLMSPLSPSSSVNGSLGDSSIGLTSCETYGDADQIIRILFSELKVGSLQAPETFIHNKNYEIFIHFNCYLGARLSCFPRIWDLTNQLEAQREKQQELNSETAVSVSQLLLNATLLKLITWLEETASLLASSSTTFSEGLAPASINSFSNFTSCLGQSIHSELSR